MGDAEGDLYLFFSSGDTLMDTKRYLTHSFFCQDTCIFPKRVRNKFFQQGYFSTCIVLSIASRPLLLIVFYIKFTCFRNVDALYCIRDLLNFVRL